MTDDELREAAQRVIELGYTVGANKDTYGEVTAILRALVARETEACAVAAEAAEDIRVQHSAVLDLSGIGTPVRGASWRRSIASAIRARSK